MNRLLTLLTLMLGLVVSSNTFAEGAAPESVEGSTTVTIEEVLEMMEETEDLVLVDARSVSDFEAGYIEGAIRLFNEDITPEVLAENIPTKETAAIFYCNGPKCGRSSDAAKKAVAAGYTNTFYFYGGIASWKEEGLPLAK